MQLLFSNALARMNWMKFENVSFCFVNFMRAWLGYMLFDRKMFGEQILWMRNIQHRLHIIWNASRIIRPFFSYYINTAEIGWYLKVEWDRIMVLLTLWWWSCRWCFFYIMYCFGLWQRWWWHLQCWWRLWYWLWQEKQQWCDARRCSW